MKIFKKLLSSLLIAGLLVLPFNSFSAGLTPDILNEDCNNITSWAQYGGGTGTATVSPAGQYLIASGATADSFMYLYKAISSPPPTFTIEIKIYFDAIGTVVSGDYVDLGYSTDSWTFLAIFGTDGLFIYKTGFGSTEVGTNIVQTGAWQIYRFQVTVGVENNATCTAWLGGTQQGGTFDCDYEAAGSDGRIAIAQRSDTATGRSHHIEYIRIATGLGAINDTSNPIINIF